MQLNRDDQQTWEEIRTLFKNTFKSSFHFSFATVDNQGNPHITPIGSLFLRKDFTGFYLERFLSKLPKNLEKNQRVCILAANSSRGFWLKSLFKGRFTAFPAVRLYGQIGEKRLAKEEEIVLFRRRIKPLRRFKGYNLMWDDFKSARDIQFDSYEPVFAGEMTKDLWKS
jgi:uncharacterized protein